ncbi:hypothetical protein PSA7680_03372 [Pseudoruegeria aquimaris]|uniref:Hedgehog/Intein (Hint) domain-containing protein n=1 Tax=Pseudoruegeria aquimaris TaxID=393663 RepID=A0A1Y5THP2_9RHOB|nr:Hint domain-containing protein [Pseudoruegeria aquimaris]SLN64084.1 hypothetical protein PSA7680_03372 [Pseudoruegeria aquimaris]
MARISELHYSNAYAASSGVAEFLEVSLAPGEDPADFTVSFYQANGSLGYELTLDTPGVSATLDPQTGEMVYVISADVFPILLTDPNGSGPNNYEAYALTDTSGSPGTVIDFYDIGGGTQNITAIGGAADGATSQSLPVLVGPESTTTTLQFNQPNPDDLTYGAVNPGDSGIACFVLGTEIDTPQGPRRIETLAPGDLVLTRDHGPQPLRWIGRTTVRGTGRFAPVRIRAGQLGATRDLWVSQQHRMLRSGWQVELLLGAEEVLVPAKQLIDGAGIALAPCDCVTYMHMLFDRHEIVTANGAASESYFPGATSLAELAPATAAEIRALFPGLDREIGYGPTARPTTSHAEGRLLQRAG